MLRIFVSDCPYTLVDLDETSYPPVKCGCLFVYNMKRKFVKSCVDVGDDDGCDGEDGMKTI